MKLTNNEEIRIKDLTAEIEGLENKRKDLKKEIWDIQVLAYERTAKYVRGDVFELMHVQTIHTGYGYHRSYKERQVLRRFVVYSYKYWCYEIRTQLVAIKKDFTLGDSSRDLYFRDTELKTAKKIGTWDFEKNVFVPLEEKKG